MTSPSPTQIKKWPLQTCRDEVVAVRSVPVKSPVGESQSNGRAENAVQRVHNQEQRTEMLVDVTRKPEFGEKIMYMTSKEHEQADAKFDDGKRLGLRLKSDESITGTPNGVIRAKTVRRLPEDHRCRAVEVLNFQGIPSNPVPGAGRGTTSQLRSTGQKHAERGEDEHAPVREREKCDTRSTVARPDPTVRRMYISRSHIRENGATEGCPGCKGIETGGSMPRNNECRTRRRARMEQSEEGREGLKKEETEARSASGARCREHRRRSRTQVHR